MTHMKIITLRVLTLFFYELRAPEVCFKSTAPNPGPPIIYLAGGPAVRASPQLAAQRKLEAPFDCD
jgi:hypothetical protein